MNNGELFKEIAAKCGAKVHQAIQLGKWLYVDTNKADEKKILELLGKMHPTKVRIAKPGADGQHLDGSKHHRIVAVF